MSLDLALSNAAGGLDLIERRLALVSQNVANAGTPGYAREVMGQRSVSAGGQGMGVRAEPARRQIDLSLQADVLAQNAGVSDWQTRSTALGAIDAALGTPGQGNDLPSLLGNLATAFSNLSADPSSAAQQLQVVQAAQGLTGGINQVAQAVIGQRQDAQDALVSEVGALNAQLGTIGVLTTQIQRLSAGGQSTADLENQRDAAVQQATQLLDIRFVPQAGGGMLAFAGGQQVPLGGGAPFAIQPATLGPGVAYPGGAPALTLNGVDVTTQISGGSIGGHLALRDSVLPGFQATLDEFSDTLATRFDAQGLTLFTDGTGAVPPPASVGQAGYLGLSATIAVNPAVVANPSLVRDGTHAVAGSATGASAFTPNPPGGPAGFATLIGRVLDYALGADAQAGVTQPAPGVAGLGPLGTINAPFAAPATLQDFAGALVAAQAQVSAGAQDGLAQAQAVQTTLQGKLSAGSAVSVDTEMATMVQLQNAYAANAKIIAATQSMWGQLLSMVGP